YEAPRLPADDRERQRQAQSSRAHDALGIAADRDPDRKRILKRTRVDRKIFERRPMFAGPRHPLSLPDAKEKLELFLEQVVVVGEVVSEEWKGFGERAAARHDLGPPTGDQIQRREVLEYTDGVVGAQHRDGARQPDAFGARSGGSQHDG